MPPRKRSRGQGGDSGAPAGVLQSVHCVSTLVCVLVCVGKKSRVSWSRSVFGQMMEATGMKLGGGQHNQLCASICITHSLSSFIRLALHGIVQCLHELMTGEGA